MSSKEETQYYPESRTDWRNWLVKNHNTRQSIWLIFYKKNSNKYSISWSEAVDEALCFGWIDSKKQTIDQYSYRQYFSQRKPNSTWSKVNKEKVAQLIENGLMTESGLHSIRIAKQNGSWTILDQIEQLIIPDDLQLALESKRNALEYFESLNKSRKKILLYWVISAKRQETRTKRINIIAESLAKTQMPKQFE